jgi:hypothetical protein
MKTNLLQQVKGFAGFVPVLLGGSTAVEGTIIDRLNYLSAYVSLGLGATAGTPTGTQLAWIIQHGNAANLSDATTYATLPALGANNANFASGTAFNANVDLTGAKRYIRAVLTPTFAAGTTPTVAAAVQIILGDKAIQPADTGAVLG